MELGDEHPSTAGVETPEPAGGAGPAGSDPAAARFQRVMAVFERAMAVEGAARERVLAQECAGDAGLRKEVGAMLGTRRRPRRA